MLSGFEVGKKYKNSFGLILEVLFVGDKSVFVRNTHDLREWSADITLVLDVWQECKEPVVTERYVLLGKYTGYEEKDVAIQVSDMASKTYRLFKMTLVDDIVTKVEPED